MAPRDTQSAKTIKSSTLSTKHLCCSCSHSPAAPVSTALGRFALSTDSPCSDNSTFVSVHCMKSCTVFATAAVKLYREQRNTCPVQLGHCLCMLGIVLSLVCFFSFPPLARLSVTACGSGCSGYRPGEGQRAGTAAPQSSSPLGGERTLRIAVLISRRWGWGA